MSESSNVTVINLFNTGEEDEGQTIVEPETMLSNKRHEP